MLSTGRRETEVGKNQRANPALMILITIQSHSSLAATSYFWATSSPFYCDLNVASIWAVRHLAGLYTAKSVSLVSVYRGKNDWNVSLANCWEAFTLRFASFFAINPRGISSPTLSSPSPLSLCIINLLRLHPYSFQQMDVIYRHTSAIKPLSEHSSTQPSENR